MNVNKGKSRVTRAPISFRYPGTRRAILEAIQRERGDAHLSDTVVEACDRLIEQHLRAQKDAAA